MEKGKRYKKENENYRKKLRKIFIWLLIISSIYFINYYKESKQQQKETEELVNSITVESNTEKPNVVNENIAKVKSLKMEYPDVVGWLEIEGTNINYPVMQGTDNSYYMTHDYKKEYAKSGSLFLDKDYDWSIPSSNLLIYGHNNKDGIMFQELLKYKDESFYKQHPTFKFTTPEEDAEYEIISAFLSRVYYKSEKNVFRYYYFVHAENEQQYDDYVLNAKKASLYDTGKTAKYGEQLITLSTCEYSQEDGRFVVVARKKK